MSADGQRTKWRRKSSENFNRLSRAHERYRQTDDRQTTDGRTTTYSEHELEFTFAKNSDSIFEFTNPVDPTIHAKNPRFRILAMCMDLIVDLIDLID